MPAPWQDPELVARGREPMHAVHREPGLLLTMGAPMQVPATHHRASDLASATHAEELTPRPEVVVHLDAAHRGLGTASCGPDTTEPYLLGPGTYRWEWTLEAV